MHLVVYQIDTKTKYTINGRNPWIVSVDAVFITSTLDLAEKKGGGEFTEEVHAGRVKNASRASNGHFS